MTSALDSYVKGWKRHQYFWKTLTKAAHTICEDGIRLRLKLKCNITSRTKSHESIRGSLERRQKARGIDYDDPEQIEEDMIDLSGIRIILTFPGDVEEVHQFLKTEFDDVHRSFWGLDENGNTVAREEKGRFIGYRATHFVVRWRNPDTGGECRYGTDLEHGGKKIEIQVTSTAMYAWQQAHHDLVYKQLQGNPSDEERALLEMINGLAHAGEMALTQLQTLSRRRIEDDERDFADEYEVGVWLKTHLRTFLGFKSSIRAPFLERSAVLFDLLSLFDLRTPAKVKKALTSTRKETRQLGLDEVLAEILDQTLCKEEAIATWADAFHSDPADWAIFRICMHHFEESVKMRDLKIMPEMRLKAFCIVNTINFALSEPLRHDFIKDVLQDVLSEFSTEQAKCAAVNTLLALVSEQPADVSNLIQEVQLMWLNLLKWIEDKASTFLCIALALSLAGIVFLPQDEHHVFLDKQNEQESRFIVWPFSSRSDRLDYLDGTDGNDGPIGPVGTNEPPGTDGLAITKTIGLGVASVSEEGIRVYNLESLKWVRARISLAVIAQGRGWKLPGGDETAVVDASRVERERHSKPMTPKRPPRAMPSTPTKQKIERKIESVRVTLQ